MFYLFQRTSPDGNRDCLEIRLSPDPKPEEGISESLAGAWEYPATLAAYAVDGWPEVVGPVVVLCCQKLAEAKARGLLTGTVSLPLPAGKYRLAGSTLDLPPPWKIGQKF
jgi:hypothetical protein